MNPNVPIVEAHSISFSYDGNKVLSNVSFEIFKNEFIGIIGPNGGGKTTLLKLILGFLSPTQGSLSVLGHPANHSSAYHDISYVPQSVKLDKEFPITVEEVILSGLLSKLPWYGVFKQNEKNSAEEALKKVGLTKFKHTPFGNLSGGQAQRVLIARALVSNPSLLLLDEPTASVDTQAESDIFAILNDLKHTMTIIMVTHDLRTAIHQVDRVLCVQNQIFALKTKEVCEHFALGLYHFPLIKTGDNHKLPLSNR